MDIHEIMYVMYACKYIVKNNVLSMKTEDEADVFMKPTYYSHPC